MSYCLNSCSQMMMRLSLPKSSLTRELNNILRPNSVKVCLKLPVKERRDYIFLYEHVIF